MATINISLKNQFGISESLPVSFRLINGYTVDGVDLIEGSVKSVTTDVNGEATTTLYQGNYVFTVADITRTISVPESGTYNLVDLIALPLNEPLQRGVPSGGDAGQVLTKKSNNDFDIDWKPPSSGGGAVTSVNNKTGDVVLTQDDIPDGTTYKQYLQTEKTKLASIETNAEVNNISDTNANDLTDGGETSLHTHDGRYYTEGEVDTLLSGKQASLGFTPENIANKNVNNGYAPLDSGGKIPLANLPATLLKYVGVWNASTNTPNLTNPDLTKVGNVYNVGTAGTQFAINWSLGDWLIYNESGIPEKSDNSDDVVSVNGQTGVVTLTTSNIPENTNLYFTTARVLATVLSGLSTATNAIITASDTVLTALGKLQKQISDNLTTLSGYITSNDIAVATKTNKLLTTNRQATSYTLALSDADKLVELNNASANNLTVPLNATVAFPVGTQILLAQYGAGQTTIVPTGGVTIRSSGGKLKLTDQYSLATLIKIATDEWYATGGLTT